MATTLATRLVLDALNMAPAQIDPNAAFECSSYLLRQGVATTA
jgi:hypothetical protein